MAEWFMAEWFMVEWFMAEWSMPFIEPAIPMSRMFVNIRMTLDTLRGAVTVPSTAVRQNETASFVWVVGSDNTVSQRTVETGVSTTTTVVISSGLKVGERVITEGGDRLTQGASVAAAGQARGQAQGQRQGQGQAQARGQRPQGAARAAQGQ
ncbi:hypothetical protein LTR94_024228 [Friedmanniomyces endolithicus]|nr:hypothetical protein LTR94_024228 [Friedmanniomyces endolithicus]